MINNNLLQDKFGRFHNYLRISITENCNLRCSYCMPSEGIKLTPKKHLMTADEIIEIAQTFINFGVNKIRLTGGEPLVRKDAKEIIARLSKLNVELAITTNGILIDEYLEIFKEAGLKLINLSIDSLQKEKYSKITRRDEFDRVCKNIDLLSKNNFKVKLNVVLIKGFNEDEIIDFIKLTKTKNIQIRFIEFMPFDGNKWNKDKLVTQNEIINIARSISPTGEIIKEEDKPNDTAKTYSIENFRGSFSIISTVSNPFCDSCNRIRLTADGKLKNCLFSNSEVSLLDAMRKGESIIPIIEKNILSKQKTRGGLETDESFINPINFNKNRTMITIGG